MRQVEGSKLVASVETLNASAIWSTSQFAAADDTVQLP